MRHLLLVAERRRAPRRAPAVVPAARAGLIAVVLAAFGTGQGTPGRPVPGPDGPTRIRGRIWRLPAARTSEAPGQR